LKIVPIDKEEVVYNLIELPESEERGMRAL
jgi:hypothetical protein